MGARGAIGGDTARSTMQTSNLLMTRISHNWYQRCSRASRPAAAQAPSPAQVRKLRRCSGFDAWVEKHRPVTGVAAVRRRARPCSPEATPSTLARLADRQHVEADHRRLYRDADPRRQAHLHHAAAGCTGRLLPPQRRPPDRRLLTVTVEQLLTHRSGLPGTTKATRFRRSGGAAPQWGWRTSRRSSRCWRSI